MVASSNAARKKRSQDDVKAPPAPTSGPKQRQRSGALDLDLLIHDRVRLGIVSALAVSDSLSFKGLKSLLGTTEGNLSVHARRLEEAGYINCRKSFDGRVPYSEYRLSIAVGLDCACIFDHMQALIRRARDRQFFWSLTL